MRSLELPFATIHLHREDIGEIVIHHGIEVSVDMVLQINQLLVENLKTPFGIISNKSLAHSHTAEAMSHVGQMKGLRAVAAYPMSDLNQLATETVYSFPKEHPFEYAIFPTFEDAIAYISHLLDEPLASEYGSRLTA